MGMEAVRAAHLAAHRLGDRHAPARLLLWMAFNVLDDERDGRPALIFFGGYKTAATGLGFRLVDLDDPAIDRAALTAVKRNLRVLAAESLIQQVRRSAPGRNAEWRLTLEPAEPVDNSAPRSRRGGATGVEDRPVQGSISDLLGVEDRPVQGSVIDLHGGRRPTPRSERPNTPEEPEHIGARTTARETDRESRSERPRRRAFLR